MSSSGSSNSTCGCCGGTSVQTPQQPSNPPGLSALAYRVGTWAAFKESLLARLSSADYPALAPLKTRSDDDFTIAFLDATAMVLDILTFYQERLANESYLRTATQLRSLTELSRLIAFQPTPGVSASVYLAFTLKTTPGLPSNPSAAPITIPQGTQVQSVPPQGETAQTFETSADIQAKSDWNTLPLQAAQPWLPEGNDVSLYLSGTSTNLQPGDAILIVGEARANAAQTSEGWDAYDIRVVVAVQPDTQNNRTCITWSQGLRGAEALSAGLASSSPPDSPLSSPLSSPPGAPDLTPPKVYALRQRAALFGYNAIDPSLLNTATTSVINQLAAAFQSLVTIGGSVTGGDKLTITLALNGGAGPLTTVSCTTTDGESLPSVATSLCDSINQTPNGTGITAKVSGQVITLTSPPSQDAPPVLTATINAVTEVLTINLAGTGVYTVTLGGTLTSGDILTLTIAIPSTSAAGGSAFNLTHEVIGGETPDAVATNLGQQIDNNSTLASAGITAGVSGTVITVRGNMVPFALSATVAAASATELVTIAPGPSNYSWSGFAMSDTIDLDSTIPKIVQGGWAVLVQPEAFDSPVQQSNRSLPGRVSLYQVSSVSTVSRTAFGLSAKISRIFPDTVSCLGDYDLRTTIALVQSEELAPAPQPLTYPLYGTVLDLADLRPDLAGARVVALSGTRQKIAIAEGVMGLAFIPDDGAQPRQPLNPGDVLTLTDPTPLLAIPLPVPGEANQIPAWASSSPLTINSLYLEDANGRTGTVLNISLSQFILAPSDPKDPVFSEYALIASLGPSSSGYPHTQIQLAKPLANCYDRTTTTVNANVGLATQGQSVADILGSGSAATPNQSFTLKHSPLTFVPAPTPSGTKSTLEILVNSVAWSQVPSLYNQGPASCVFAAMNQADGTTDVVFGDGAEGALLPTGQNNLQANYRYGLGSSGNVPAGTITTLMDRPLGVSGVINPQAATGGQDPQSNDDIRASAPQAVLTLGRAVSIADYQNLAATFAGIAKACAVWIPSGPSRGVFLTVAGIDGVAVPAGSPTQAGLVASLQTYGNPSIPITVVTFAETLFTFSANLQIDPAYSKAAVEAEALQAVTRAFSFTARSFGQGVSTDEIASVLQGVPGVVAVNVTNLTREQSSTAGDISGLAGTLTVAELKEWLASQITLPRLFPDSPTHLSAFLPVANAQAQAMPAEILVLDPGFTVASLGTTS